MKINVYFDDQGVYSHQGEANLRADASPKNATDQLIPKEITYGDVHTYRFVDDDWQPCFDLRETEVYQKEDGLEIKLKEVFEILPNHIVLDQPDREVYFPMWNEENACWMSNPTKLMEFQKNMRRMDRDEALRETDAMLLEDFPLAKHQLTREKVLSYREYLRSLTDLDNWWKEEALSIQGFESP